MQEQIICVARMATNSGCLVTERKSNYLYDNKQSRLVMEYVESHNASFRQLILIHLGNEVTMLKRKTMPVSNA